MCPVCTGAGGDRQTDREEGRRGIRGQFLVFNAFGNKLD